MLFSIAGKKAFITGASGGIGKAIALRFAAEGATCVLAGRKKSCLEAVLAELDSTYTTKVSKANAQGNQDESPTERAKHGIRAMGVSIASNWSAAAQEHVSLISVRLVCSLFR
jgi:NAD(P)-dependent dehydrogenase (short-subunit alcohol dehydrogenase family)